MIYNFFYFFKELLDINFKLVEFKLSFIKKENNGIIYWYIYYFVRLKVDVDVLN